MPATPTEGGNGTVLQLTDVTRRFARTPALDRVTFTVAPGETVGFVGRNGAGKTTALRIIMGVLAPDAGEVTWQGAPVDDAVRRRFGYLPEERGLYPRMRVADQLAFFAELGGCAPADARDEALGWLARLEVDGDPDGPVEALSLGNQQRGQLAAALLGRPALLVLDEPFSGLDPVGTRLLARVIAAERDRGAAVLFSSHQPELVERVSDRVVIVHDGRVVDDPAQAHGPRRVVAEVERGRTGWADELPGVTVVARAGDRVDLDVEPDVPPERVLDAARAAGPVRVFLVQRPGLAERFHEVVDG